MGSVILLGFAIFLILEGLMPLLLPSAWKEAVRKMAELNDGQLRFVGLAMLTCGALLLLFVSM
jgi:uncharacterized protein